MSDRKQGLILFSLCNPISTGQLLAVLPKRRGVFILLDNFEVNCVTVL